MDFGKNEGPKIKKTFVCEGCIWLSDISIISKQYFCVHPQMTIIDNDWRIFNSIEENLLTPFTCPFLLKRMRKEKLNEING